MPIDVKLPELGAGIDSADVLEVLVGEGDRVRKDQGILEIETDKATVAVPTPYPGVVRKVHVRKGQSIQPGTVLITLDPVDEAVGASASPPAGPGTTAPVGSVSPPATTPAPGQTETRQAAAPSKPLVERQAGPPQQPAKQTVQPAAHAPTFPHAAPLSPSASLASQTAPDTPASAAESDDEEPPSLRTQAGGAYPQVVPPAGATVIAAGPAVRRFAREVGVDLRLVRGTGPGGRITRQDVLDFVRQASQSLSGKPGTSTDAWGPIRREKLSRVRRTIAEKMHLSWTSVPHVTNFDDADITELERIRQASKADYAQRGIKLTTLPFVIKAAAMALRCHPQLNASLDLEKQEVIFKEYVNIGVAIDSDRGLVVPVLRDVDTKSIPEIARWVAQWAEKVRNGDYTVEDLRGGTFTVSNLGAIGGTYATPIINVPEVAILLVGRSRKMPVVVDDQIAIRLMMPLSLSYDHRLVDGAVAARFLNEVKGYLEAPSRLLLAP
jgi:pyruvate dehydrogenase E2 component (dihydrolipoamide acetyltransferase)